MQKVELITELREYLKDKETVASDAAPALKLLRHSLVLLTSPEEGMSEEAEQRLTRLELDVESYEATITQLRDDVSDREGYLYAIISDAGMMPEIDDEPMESLRAALESHPDLLDRYQLEASIKFQSTDPDREEQEQKERFIAAVRRLIENGEFLGLQELWDKLEAKANYLSSLEGAVKDRDEKLASAESLLSRIIDVVGLDWQDIDALPEHILGLIHHAGELQENANNPVLYSGNKDVNLSELLKEGTNGQKIRVLPDNDFQEYPSWFEWAGACLDLAYAVRGNLSRENRILATAAENILLHAPVEVVNHEHKKAGLSVTTN